MAHILDGTNLEGDFLESGLNDLTISNTAEDQEVEDLLLTSLTKKKKKKKAVAAPVEEVKEDENSEYAYTELLERIFGLLQRNNQTPGDRKKSTLPHPQLIRAGVRKTMWTNFLLTCQILQRSPEHLMSFICAELGSEASLDGSQRLVIKGRYLNKQAESLLKKYISEYVTCHMCRNPETALTRDAVTRLYFLECAGCSSRRSVAPIKSGFHATNRADRKAAKAGK